VKINKQLFFHSLKKVLENGVTTITICFIGHKTCLLAGRSALLLGLQLAKFTPEVTGLFLHFINSKAKL
jgi:hypothetical protein